MEAMIPFVSMFPNSNLGTPPAAIVPSVCFPCAQYPPGPAVMLVVLELCPTAAGVMRRATVATARVAAKSDLSLIVLL